ncbi:uncharacterized protein LOC125478798 [Pyrus x bretschneideri]|uniref:uncharacterized protein LOC125478798 n=1 Tax=Pyrus x bretschneideri TaxID=225117 RepID=UPI00202F361A|nr:uncharacterized protein LOC125478798 [Pyrus x bretschneideri]
MVDLSGIREDSPNNERLLPVVQDLRGSLVNQVRGIICRVEVVRLAEVVVDDSRPRDCYRKIITFHHPGLPEVTFVGQYSRVRHDVISAMRAKRLLSKGCQGYLAHVLLNDVAPSSVEDVKVVKHFPNVFPDDLPRLPTHRDVEFIIDLLPGTDPISLTPYRMAHLKINNEDVPKTTFRIRYGHYEFLSFQQLKYYLTHALVLALPDDNGNFEVYNDASLNGLGCVLMQHDLRSTGVKLKVKDPEEALLANFQVRPILIDRVLKAQMDDEEIHELIEARSQGKKKDLRVRETDGMLMQKSKVYVPNNVELKKEILDEVHCLAYAMHPGGLLLSSGWHFRRLWDRAWHKRLDLMEFLVLEGPEIVEETTQNIQVIKSNLKAAQDRQKSLADKHATDRVYKVGDWLEFPPELSKVHDVFHVSMLRHYVSDPLHVIPPQPSVINPDLTYDKEPVTILDWKDKVLRNKTVRLVKVLWRNHSVEEATWEIQEHMKELYPRLFYDY